MPKTYSNPGSDESLYTDAEPEQQAPAAPAEEGAEKETSSGPVAEIPKSLLAGKEFKPGESIMLKIVSIKDDSVIVEYDYGDEDQEKEVTAPTEQAPQSNEYGAMLE